MQFQDYYQVLGVDRKASDKEIRAAYRRLARQHHPDLNPGNKEAEERFKAINEAHEVLSDPEKRKRYDELGSRWKEYEQWQRAQQTSGAQGQPFDWSRFGYQEAPGRQRFEQRTMTEDDLREVFRGGSPFSDFFQTFFGGPPRGGQRGRRRGADAEHPIEVSLADAYRGTMRRLELQLANGPVRRLDVRIPPGVRDGSRIRIAGQGAPGTNGAPPGDVYLIVSVQPDARFERRGDELLTKVSAPVTAFVLGGETKVPTPDGRELALRLPAGTRDGQVFRLRGQGMPRLEDPAQRSDLLAEVHVALPVQVSARQRELFDELARLESGEHATVG